MSCYTHHVRQSAYHGKISYKSIAIIVVISKTRHHHHVYDCSSIETHDAVTKLVLIHHLWTKADSCHVSVILLSVVAAPSGLDIAWGWASNQLYLHLLLGITPACTEQDSQSQQQRMIDRLL